MKQNGSTCRSISFPPTKCSLYPMNASPQMPLVDDVIRGPLGPTANNSECSTSETRIFSLSRPQTPRQVATDGSACKIHGSQGNTNTIRRVFCRFARIRRSASSPSRALQSDSHILPIPRLQISLPWLEARRSTPRMQIQKTSLMQGWRSHSQICKSPSTGRKTELTRIACSDT